MRKAKPIFADIANVTAGAVLFGVSINIFLIPNDLVAGGSSGAATLLAHLTGLGVGFLNILINIPLLAVSIRENGWRATAKTAVGTAAVSLASDIFAFLPHMSGDLLLCAAAGGGGMGLGSGIMMLRGYTSGGVDIAAYMLHRRAPRFPTGRIIIIIDGAIILTSVAVLKNYALLPYCVICSAVYGFAIDFVMGGSNVCRSVFIVSERYAQIADRIFAELDRGVTMLDGCGWYTKEKRPVLFCVVRRKEEFELRRIVSSADPEAFIVLHSSCEAIGDGFTKGREKRPPAGSGG